MPYWQDYFSKHNNVSAFTAGDIDKHDLSDIEVLLLRSTTKVNAALLQSMPKLRFVGTATAGYDHFDIPEIEARGITWTAAGGCNATAVAQYVICALLHLACKDNFLLNRKRVAIVGNGNVGSKVKDALSRIGVTVLSYDPPQQRDLKDTSANDQACQYASFEDILNCDIICLHAPFNSDAQYPSYHLFDDAVLKKLSNKQYLINAGRGELIDNQALLKLKQSMPEDSVNIVLDVWENEPCIERALIPYCRLASAHIAGHTLEGKAAGTHILYEKLNAFKNQVSNIELSTLLPAFSLVLPSALQKQLLDEQVLDAFEVQAIVKQLCSCVYDIENDDRVFRRYMAQSTSFAKIRQQYPVRREFSALHVKVRHKSLVDWLIALGFIVSSSSTTQI